MFPLWPEMNSKEIDDYWKKGWLHGHLSLFHYESCHMVFTLKDVLYTCYSFTFSCDKGKIDCFCDWSSTEFLKQETLCWCWNWIMQLEPEQDLQFQWAGTGFKYLFKIRFQEKEHVFTIFNRNIQDLEPRGQNAQNDLIHQEKSELGYPQNHKSRLRGCS